MLQVTAYMSLQSEQAPKYVRGEVSRHQRKFDVSNSLLCTLGIFHLPETLGNFSGKGLFGEDHVLFDANGTCLFLSLLTKFKMVAKILA